MKLSFLPGDLHLDPDGMGDYIVRIGSVVLLRSKSEHAALKSFIKLRRELEARFPPSEPSADERRRAFLRELLDSQVKHNSLREQPRKKLPRTRTFG